MSEQPIDSDGLETIADQGPPVASGAQTSVFAAVGDHIRRAASIDAAPKHLFDDERQFFATTPSGLTPATAFGRLLVWRRSLLALAVYALVPAIAMELISTLINMSQPGDNPFIGIQFLLALLNIGLLVGVYQAERRWSSWESSRKMLFGWWIVAFLGPFLVSLIPFRSLVGAGGRPDQMLVVGMVGALQYVIVLAPKALSLMPGLIRAALAMKQLFPSSGAPGWLVLVTAPIFVLFLFVVLIVPYQLSASPMLVVAIGFFIAAPVWLWRSARTLILPTTYDDVLEKLGAIRRVSMALNAVGAVCLVIALAQFFGDLDLSIADALQPVFAIVANVLVMTVVCLDIVANSVAHASVTPDPHAQQELSEQVDAFVAAVVATQPVPDPLAAEPEAPTTHDDD